MLCLRFQFSKILVKYIEEYIHFLFKWQFSCIVHGRVLARHALQIKFLGQEAMYLCISQDSFSMELKTYLSFS